MQLCLSSAFWCWLCLHLLLAVLVVVAVTVVFFFIGGDGIGFIHHWQQLHSLSVVFNLSLFISGIGVFVSQWHCQCWLCFHSLLAVLEVALIFVGGDGLGFIHHWQRLHPLSVGFDLSLFVSGIGGFVHQWHWRCWLCLRVLLAVIVVASFFIGDDGFGSINLWQQLHSSLVVFNLSLFVSSIRGFVYQWHWQCWLRLCSFFNVLMVTLFFIGSNGFGFINRWQRLHSLLVVFDMSSFVHSIGGEQVAVSFC